MPSNASGKEFDGAGSPDFWYRLRVEPTKEQLNALGNYRDIITQNASKVAEALGISLQTLTGWTEGKGELTSEQAERILEFLRDQNKAR
jgi:transcriptional regulator with XRE-family HTH domain